ncbi:MAG: MFS transporter [Gaiellaceae bacterium]
MTRGASLRDFRILLAGQVVSALGTRISGVASPLLVLALTHSATKAGVFAFAETLPILVLTLYAGAVVDRYDRKRLMLWCEGVRAVALLSVGAGAIWGFVSFPQLIVVGFVDGAGFTLFEVAQRAALKQLVPVEDLPHAAALNQRREYGALLVGTPLGGALYGLGRAVPFVADAASYAASFFSLLLIERPLNEARVATSDAPSRIHREIAEGVRWLWREPFLRINSILVVASDLSVNALYLVVIVVARRGGASPALIGAMLLFLGAGGIAGSLIAPRLIRALPIQAGIYATLATITVLLPLIAFVRNPIALGVVYGAMFVPYPTWSASLSSYRAVRTPDDLQGRVQSVFTLISLGAVPFGLLAVGVSLQHLGAKPTVFALFTLMLAATAFALASPQIRHAPALAA